MEPQQETQLKDASVNKGDVLGTEAHDKAAAESDKPETLTVWPSVASQATHATSKGSESEAAEDATVRHPDTSGTGWGSQTGTGSSNGASSSGDSASGGSGGSSGCSASGSSRNSSSRS